MSDEADRENGLHNLWSFGWNAGGVIGVILFVALIGWFYGNAALGWWGLVHAYRALPDGMKSILAALIFAFVYMAWTIVRMDKAHRVLRDRVNRLEHEAWLRKQQGL